VANDGFAVKSNGSDLASWQTVISGVFGTDVFLGTSDYIYAAVSDNVWWHDSTVRRSSDGVNFTTISGPGPFKFPIGNPMYYEGTAYIFENGGPYEYNNGYLVTDDGTTTTTTAMSEWNYRILAATELNGQIYAIGLDHGYNVDGNVYLLTTVPEPTTFVLLGVGMFSLLAYSWRRRRMV
jgi:hypothetical protein